MDDAKPVCDVCGKPATCGAQDMREIEPVRGLDGKLWANSNQLEIADMDVIDIGLELQS